MARVLVCQNPKKKKKFLWISEISLGFGYDNPLNKKALKHFIWCFECFINMRLEHFKTYNFAKQREHQDKNMSTNKFGSIW